MRNKSCAYTAILVCIGVLKLNFVAHISKLATTQNDDFSKNNYYGTNKRTIKFIRLR